MYEISKRSYDNKFLVWSSEIANKTDTYIKVMKKKSLKLARIWVLIKIFDTEDQANSYLEQSL